MNEVMLNKRFLYEIGLVEDFHKKNPNKLPNFIIENLDPLTIKIVLMIRGFEYIFNVIYPKLFPYQPIIVIKITSFRTPHSYKNNSMCLKYGIDNWNEDINSEDILNNLVELLEVENPLGETHGTSPSGDKFTLGQLARWNNKYIYYIHSNIFEHFSKIGYIELYFKRDLSYTEGIYFTKSIDQVVFDNTKLRFDVLKFLYLKLPYSKQKILNLYTEKEIHSLIMSFNIEDSSLDRGFLLITNDNEIVFIIKEADEVTLVEVLSIDEEISKRINLPGELLHNKITIFGLGSVGSRVFLDLARAGFDNFMLIDDDIFLPHNIIRHELNLDYIGEQKVVALEKYAKEKINPLITIDYSTLAITGQESTTAVNNLYQRLEDSKIIIDCTANDNLTIQLSKFVEKNNIKYIAGSIFSGGFGNMLMKTDNPKHLSPLDLLQNHQSYYNSNPHKFTQGHDYLTREGDKEYIATMSDCSIIAGLIGKTAISMLSGDEMFYFPSDIYYFSTSNHSFFETPQPYSTIPLNATKAKRRIKSLNKTLVNKGKKLYEDYLARKNN